MADATVRFTFDATDVQEVSEQLRKVATEARIALLRLALGKERKRLRRAYLNMLRSTRRNRKEKVWKWRLAKLRVRVAEIRVEKPNAENRIVSRRMKNGEPIVLIDAVYARGQTESSQIDRRTVLLGHRLAVAEIDECPIEILSSSNG